jgi:hypothetical protein
VMLTGKPSRVSACGTRVDSSTGSRLNTPLLTAALVWCACTCWLAQQLVQRAGVVAAPGTYPSPAACHMSTRQNTTALRTSGLGWWKAAKRPGSSWSGATDSSSLGLILGATSCNSDTHTQAPTKGQLNCGAREPPRPAAANMPPAIGTESASTCCSCLPAHIPAWSGWWRTAPPHQQPCRCLLLPRWAACARVCQHSAAGAWTASARPKLAGRPPGPVYIKHWMSVQGGSNWAGLAAP